jgi:Bacterial Ig-like domain (group 3)
LTRRGHPGRVRRLGVAVVVIAVVGWSTLASSAAGADFTWDGASTVPSWSDPTNWAGGAAPSGAVGMLDFPLLASGACTAVPPAATCYASNNDTSGLAAAGISIDDGAGYLIDGNPITLGSGGLSAAPSAGDPTLSNPSSELGVPLTLSAPQTWSVTGGAADQQLLLTAPVAGPTADALAIELNDETGLSVTNAEVGPVALSGDGLIGDGALKLGYIDATGALVPGSLNQTDGEPTSVTDGATLLSDDGTVGPVSTTGGAIQVGQYDRAGTLAVAGTVALDAQSALVELINQPGTTVGTDFSQLTATGTVNLAGATLLLVDGETPGSTACEQLTPGGVDTLVDAPSGVSGALIEGVVNGAIVPINDGTTVTLLCDGSGGRLPTATIDYTPTTVTATIVSAGTPGAPTATTLAADQSSYVTNQPVTLTASVTSTGDAPTGTVAFDNGSTPIPGCATQPVTPSGGSYVATCQTALTASATPDVTAFFDPADGSSVAPSTSTAVPLSVGTAPTTTTVSISPASVGPNQPITMTATVTPSNPGTAEPSGTIDFLVNGAPVPAGAGGSGCSAVPLTAGSSSSTAQCNVEFSGDSGSLPETITATYGGDANFTASTSGSQTGTYVASATPGTSQTTTTTTTPAVEVSGGIGRAGFGQASATATMLDVIVTCAGARGERCTVTLKLTAHELTRDGKLVSASAAKTSAKPKAIARTVVVGTRTVTLDAGVGETAHVTLNAAGKRALASLHRLPVTVTASEQTSKGASTPTLRHVTFTAVEKAA